MELRGKQGFAGYVTLQTKGKHWLETLVIFIFILFLVGCLVTGLPVLVALAAGFLLFFGYGIFTGHGPARMAKAALSRVYKIRTILQIFALIGLLTALWREAGTIPAITYYASSVVRPGIMVLTCFLLNCLISFLTGSSFASTATMGVITMSMARIAGVPAVVASGAILSGVYFGDRCSPVSTSALLIATVTKTNIFDNIRECLKTAVVPFAASCVIYGVLGIVIHTGAGAAADLAVRELFAKEFRLGFVPLLPAVLILVLAALRIRVILAMSVSIISAFIISILYQHAPLWQVVPDLLSGYHARLPELSGLISGGGLKSMLNPAMIVCLSSSYAGIFEETGLLQGLKGRIRALADRTSPFAATLLTSVVSCAIACNQTLAVILTEQLCHELQPDRQLFAIDIENSTAVIAALIPWNIACAVPLATLGAPPSAVLLACYLYFLPCWRLITERRRYSQYKSAAYK